MGLSADAEAHVWTVAEQEDLSARDAVAHALAARHLKRIARHLGNIATAVIQPVDWMNYSDEPRPGDIEEPPKRQEDEEEE
jgi:phosphate uptake regulator